MSSRALRNPDSRVLPFSQRVAKWLKLNLFSTPANSMLSIVIISILALALKPLFDWLIFNAVWSGDANTCREASGACYVFLKEKFVFILFGFFPREEIWRAILSLVLFVGHIWWSKEPSRWNRKLLYQWVGLIFIIAALMKGGVLSLAPISMDKWGGLPLTMMLSFIGISVAYPVGILLALGRRSHLSILKTLSVLYIELIRGIPMISMLFMASVMFPLFLPEGVSVPKLIRAQVAIIMFVSAYMAEVVRGGLAAVEKGQYEAADSLGLTYWQQTRLVILPQALKIVIPPTVNTTIGMFKDTSLVVIIALFDLLMTSKSSLRDPEWLGFSVEAYLFVAIIYFICCFSMGRYSQRLEREFERGHN